MSLLSLILIILSHSDPEIQKENDAEPFEIMAVKNVHETNIKVFEEEIIDSETQAVDKSTFVLGAVGDIMLDRGVARSNKNVLKNVPELKGKVDYLVANLESVIGNIGTPVNKSFVFQAKPKWAKLLKDNGFNGFSLANNHSYDYGEKAHVQSENILKQEGLDIFGGQNHFAHIHEIQISGSLKKIAFVGLSAFSKGPHSIKFKPGRKLVAEKLAKLKNEADFIVASVHWGKEYKYQPYKKQIELSQWLQKEGVGLLIGHHPHVLQSVGAIENMPVFFSLGNFIFDQPWSYSRESVLSLVEFQLDSHLEMYISKVRFNPINIKKNIWVPEVARKKRHNKINQRIFANSFHKKVRLKKINKVWGLQKCGAQLGGNAEQDYCWEKVNGYFEMLSFTGQQFHGWSVMKSRKKI